jgi:mannose-6-phosphate isomerase-like protein (cupin superfamily)
MFKLKKVFTPIKFLIALIVIVVLIAINIFTYYYYQNRPNINLALIDGQANNPYITNIIKETEQNTDYRRVLFTGTRSQLVIMSIPPGGEVGEETHTYTEQTLFFLSGTAKAILGGKESSIKAGDVVVVTPGTKHNFINTGTDPLKIYTVYAPPNHIDGTTEASKAEADANVQDEAYGQQPK